MRQLATHAARPRASLSRRPGGSPPAAAARTLVVLSALVVTGLWGPHTAFAGAGDFCSWCDLGPHAVHVGNYRTRFIETESWNSDGKGVGSCTGVGTSRGSFAVVACHGDATGYNEVYCTGCNGAQRWYSLLENDSNHGYNSVFTGWEDYA
jgi:hypothetical protein